MANEKASRLSLNFTLLGNLCTSALSFETSIPVYSAYNSMFNAISGHTIEELYRDQLGLPVIAS